MDAIEKRARELLARAYEADGMVGRAGVIRNPTSYMEKPERRALGCIIAALTPAEGYVLVPVEPTREMVECAVYAQEPSVGSPAGGSNNANRLRRKAKRIWAAMLNASGKS
jgi:hypothetical protein